MLYIRADGNAEIGIGHIMRCLSIAKAHRKSGGDCTFITADTNMKPLLDEQGFSVICLDSKWDDLSQETEKMERLIEERKIEKLLVDSYFVTPDYLSRLHKLTYLIYMDDLDAFVYPCSALINYNIYADKLCYSARYDNTKLLLGLKYTPIREEFMDMPTRKISEDVHSVLVLTGGADPYNVAGKFTSRAMVYDGLSRLAYHIVSGRFNEHLPELLVLSKKYSGITIHQNISNLSKLMLECDIAVSAGGSTLYELCASGMPAVIFASADNQLAAISAFSEGYMLGCGDYREDPDTCLEKLVAGIAKLTKETKLRQEFSSKCRDLVDGLGAYRISDSLRTQYLTMCQKNRFRL